MWIPCALVLPLLAAAPVQAPVPPSLAADVDAYVAHFVRNHDFSGSILIARKGRIVFERGYGSADIEFHIPITPRTAFGIGSITKTFTSAAIELLAERGAISLDDPLSKFIPYPHGDSITVEQLLAHSAGIRDVYRLGAYAQRRAESVSLDQLTKILGSEPLDFTPGTSSAYSNSGYALLAAIIEHVSAKPYSQFVHDELLAPLGMNHSGSLSVFTLVEGLAEGYDPGFPPTYLQRAAQVGDGWDEGSGSMYTSAEDLFRWAEATRSEKLVKHSRWKYPYGWHAGTRFGQPMIEQNGRVPMGYSSYLGVYSASDVVIVVLSNIQADVETQMGADLAAMVFGQKVEAPAPQVILDAAPDAATLSALDGRYAISQDFVLTVRTVPNGLLLAGPDGAFLPVDAMSSSRFFFRPLSVPIAFERDSAGLVTALDWNGQVKAKRVGSDAASPREDRRQRR